MSFSSDVKTELCAILPPAAHCRKAGLAAMLCLLGEVSEQAKEPVLLLSRTNAAALSKCFTLLEKIINIKGDAAKGERSARRTATRIPLTQAQAAALSGLTEENTVRRELLKNACCRRAVLRDSFLCAGSVNSPEKEYHLEFALPAPEQAEQIRDILDTFGIPAKITRRKNSHVVYVKDSDAIADVLNLMGAHTALMRMQNSLIRKEVRNTINRIVNVEAANIEKTVQAASRQIEDIRFLRKSGVWQTLPKTLREVAILREKYPEASLKEIGGKLSPPVGKSGINHRLRKLSELAEEVRAR